MVSSLTVVLSISALLLALGVAKVYKTDYILPKKKDYRSYLRHGIFVSALATSLNIFYWKVAHRLVKWLYGADSPLSLNMIDAGLYVDLLFVSCLTWTMWCHLKSVHLLLPEEDQEHYSAIGMIWHPRKIKNIVKKMWD